MIVCIDKLTRIRNKPITFPNHWSLVTGLYPESHGVVGNYFWDSQLNDSFYYKSPSHSWDEKWWGGEPVSAAYFYLLLSLFIYFSSKRSGLLLYDKTKSQP
jgi:predicted AlkP superfamily pyrophosphatase or phosphodiesterase